MAGSNGVAMLAPIRLGDLSPETVTVTVSRPNPMKANLAEDDPRRLDMPDLVDVRLPAYVSGRRCPVPVSIASEEAWQQWREAQADATLSPSELRVALSLRIVKELKAVIPGLTDGERDVLASNEEAVAALMRQLEWWTPLPTGAAANPEVMGTSPSTMADSSPSSAPSTTAPVPSIGTPT